MSLERGALDLVDGIYEAALEPKRWFSFLDRLADSISADAICLFLRCPQLEHSGRLFSVGVEPAWEMAYAQFHVLSAGWSAKSAAIREEVIVHGKSVFPFDPAQKSDLYDEWMRPNGYRFTLGANLRSKGRASSLNLAAMRSWQAQPFGLPEQQLCSMLLPHLQRTLEIYERAHQAGVERDSMRQALDRLSLGVLATDEHARVLWANRAAEELVRKSETLVIDRDGLHATRSEQASRLQELIAEAGAGAPRQGQLAGKALSIPRGRAHTPLDVVVTSASGTAPLGGRASHTSAIFISDPEQRNPTPVAPLRALYGLTRAEASLAALLAVGCTLAEAADQLGIVLSTARTQLRSIFSKTNTHQQSALVRLLTQGVASLRLS